MSILTQGAKAIGRNAGKIIKGIKQGAPAVIKGIKSSGVSIGKGLKSASSAGAGLLSRTGSSVGGAVSTAGGAINRGAAAAGSAATAAGQTIRNTTSAVGSAVGKGVQKVKNLFKAKPQGVVVEKVIKKGGPPKKPVLRTRVREGNFSSTGDPNLGIKQIEKVMKKGLAKKNAVKVVKKVKPQTVKTAVIKPQKGMAYI